MITDADIKKLKTVFATKDDLKQFATKDDLAATEKRLEKKIIDGVAEYMQDNIIPLLNQHEKRLDRLEKHMGGFPSIA